MTVLVPARPVWPAWVYDLAVEDVRKNVPGATTITALVDRIVRTALNSEAVAEELVKTGHGGYVSALDLKDLPALSELGAEVFRLRAALERIAYWTGTVAIQEGAVGLREYARKVLEDNVGRGQPKTPPPGRGRPE